MIHIGDCLEVMRTLDANSVDAIVTDPPYHLTTGKKGGTGAASDNPNSPAGRARIGTGFMGMAWDGGDIAMRPDTWAEVLRVAKPGAYLCAFGGTRTYHRMACAIEDAGWELRDTLMWVYGSGFPKSHNGEWGGTALKPAWEPIILARKPLDSTVAANVLAHGTGALNIDGCRVGAEGGKRKAGPAKRESVSAYGNGLNGGGRTPIDAGRWPANVIHDGSEEVLTGFPHSKDGVASSNSRGFSADGYVGGTRGRRPGGFGNVVADKGDPIPCGPQYGDAGSAARFFYCAKADRADRNDGCDGMPEGMTRAPNGAENAVGSKRGSRSTPRANIHPTVKPTDLMRWLCRLVTPTGGLILDPFTGSGSTGRGAILEGFRFVGCELSAEYVAIAEARIAAAVEQRRIDTMQPNLFGEAA